MKITVKLAPDAKTAEREIKDVEAFLDEHPLAQVKVLDRWVPFEKVYPVMKFF